MKTSKYSVVEEVENVKKIIHVTNDYLEAQDLLREVILSKYREYYFEGELEKFNEIYHASVREEDVPDAIGHLSSLYAMGIRGNSGFDLYRLLSDLRFIDELSKTPGKGGIFYGPLCLIVDVKTFYGADFDSLTFGGEKYYIEKTDSDLAGG